MVDILRDIVVPNKSLVVYGGARLGDQWARPAPLFSIHPNCDYTSQASNWVICKAKEMQNCMGIKCDGYEYQFIALLAAIEAGQT